MCDTRKSADGGDIARITGQITSEYEAFERIFLGPVTPTRYERITACIETMGRLQDELLPLVGSQRVMALVVEALKRAEVCEL